MAKNKKTVVKEIDTTEEIENEEIEEVEETNKNNSTSTKKDKLKKVLDDDFNDEDDDVEENEYIEITMEERITNIEKKSNYTFILTIITLIVSLITMLSVINNGVAKTETESNDTSTSDTEYTYDTSSFKTITASDIKTESKSETIVLLIARQGCIYCSYYAPILVEVAKDYDITVRYIDLSTIINFNLNTITDSDSYNTLSSLSGSGDWETFAKDNITGTPLTLIIKNNKVIGGVSGYVEATKVESAFTAAGITK